MKDVRAFVKVRLEFTLVDEGVIPDDYVVDNPELRNRFTENLKVLLMDNFDNPDIGLIEIEVNTEEL